MIHKICKVISFGFLIMSCQEQKEQLSEETTKTEWLYTLNQLALNNLDSSNWDLQLFNQDVDNYNNYTEIFNSYPLIKSPFPVTEYDYAVSNNPFTLEVDNKIFNGLCIGEYMNPESDEITDRLTILIQTNDPNAEENTLVESRNAPYLTAQGYIKCNNQKFDWIFVHSPDGFSSLLLNMKLFDLRFGETIIIYPQKDNAFFYDQIKDSPNNYSDFEEYKRTLSNNQSIINQINNYNINQKSYDFKNDNQ